jgi:hypothetical protein
MAGQVDRDHAPPVEALRRLFWEHIVPLSRFPEESGAHVVPLGGAGLPMATGAPKTAELSAELGHKPFRVDISGYETLEACATASPCAFATCAYNGE